MKICLSICGLPRCLDLVVKNMCKLFENDEIDFIFCISDLFIENKDKYFENVYLNICSDRHRIIKRCFFLDKYDSSFTNSLNYSYKIVEGIKSQEDGYDIYIIMRSDLIIENIDLSKIDCDKIYFLNNNINQFTLHTNEKINDSIIISKSYKLLKSFYNFFEYNLNNTNYPNIVLYNYVKKLNITNIDFIDCKYKIILFECNVIAIAGDSGSGKTTLLKCLKPLFDSEKSLILETDRYHKWERGDENYKKYTHLNPYSNHLEKMYEDVYDLKIGNEVYQVDYDHSSGKFTQKEKIESKNNLIICGLHTFYEKNIKSLLDLKIFMDTDRELIKKWKIKRDVEERGYSIEKVINQIQIREEDYNKYIVNQKETADIVIHFYELNSEIKCKFILQNENITTKVFKILIDLNYKFKVHNNLLHIELKNNFAITDKKINELINQNKNFFNCEYYKEIFYFIYISLS